MLPKFSHILNIVGDRVMQQYIPHKFSLSQKVTSNKAVNVINV